MIQRKLILYKINDSVSSKTVQHFPGSLTTQEKVKHGSTRKEKKRHKDAPTDHYFAHKFGIVPSVHQQSLQSQYHYRATVAGMQGGPHQPLASVVALSGISPRALSTAHSSLGTVGGKLFPSFSYSNSRE